MKANLSGGHRVGGKESILDSQGRVPFENESVLLDLVRLRSAQINGCSLGILNHTNELKIKGLPEAKIQQVEDWCTLSLFTEREKVALSLAEAISISNETITESILSQAQKHFTKSEIAFLVVAILAVNHFADPLPSE